MTPMINELNAPDSLMISMAMTTDHAGHHSIYSDQKEYENRIKRMKMSNYFKRPKQFYRHNTGRYIPSTAETLQVYDHLNADLEIFSTNPVVKLRVEGKKPQKSKRKEED